MIRSYSSTVMRRGVNGAKVGGSDTIGCVGVAVDMVSTLSPDRPLTAPILPSAPARCTHFSIRALPFSSIVCAHIPTRMTTRTMNEHELAFNQSFILPQKRSQYLQLLPNPKRRRKLLDRLNHSSDVDFSLATPLQQHNSSRQPRSLTPTPMAPACSSYTDCISSIVSKNPTMNAALNDSPARIGRPPNSSIRHT